MVNKIPYGAYTHTRGLGTSYAYIDGRTPVRIAHILHLCRVRRDPRLPRLEASVAIVQRFQNDGTLPIMPWSMRYATLSSPHLDTLLCLCSSAVDLGLSVWNANVYEALEVIALHRFSGQFALAEIREVVWVAISIETVSYSIHSYRALVS